MGKFKELALKIEEYIKKNRDDFEYLETLNKDDFICINVGNSQFKFLNDFQSKMESW